MKAKKGSPRRFRVVFEIKGSMIDKDTPMSEQSLTDFVELHFSHREDCRVYKVDVEEVKED